MNLFKSLALVASLTFLAGCATQKPAEQPAPAPEKPADEPKQMPSVVSGQGWSIDLQNTSAWEKRSLPRQNSVTTRVEGNWVSTKKLGDSYAVLTVFSTATDVGQDEGEFIRDIFIEQDKNDNVKFFNVRKVQIQSGDIGGVALLAQRYPHGVMGMIELVTARKARGYVVQCAGAVEDAEEWTPVCAEVLASFEIK